MSIYCVVGEVIVNTECSDLGWFLRILSVRGWGFLDTFTLESVAFTEQMAWPHADTVWPQNLQMRTEN